MLSGGKCEEFLCAQLWNKVRVFMRLNKKSSRVRGRRKKWHALSLIFSVRLRTRLLFLSQLIKNSNYRKFKSKHIRNPTFPDPILQRAPGFLSWVRRLRGAQTVSRGRLPLFPSLFPPRFAVPSGHCALPQCVLRWQVPNRFPR